MKEKGPSEGLMAAAREILSYLVEHPDAKDTTEGIKKWWLAKRNTETEKDEVQEAIDFLVAKGWVISREITDSKKIYGVDMERMGEIRAFLKKISTKGKEMKQ